MIYTDTASSSKLPANPKSISASDLDVHTCCAYNKKVCSSSGTCRKPKPTTKSMAYAFSESLRVFEDDYAITVSDIESDPGELRFVSIGMV
jgi:hypothetical protein